MSFKKACTRDELWEGDMLEVDVDGRVVLLVGLDGGDVRAYQGVCPHQDIPLAEGKFDGRVLVCRAHQWSFDARSGAGINPGDCSLAEYPVKLEGDDVFVDVEGVVPRFAHT
ncbi:MAG TPA: Rieske 2Fe-2S domain-containing protein [Burkholderiaceae bacterium]|nr:Rieske 2Fe-2S domain-containing protein [Burkholderiaceae bacterium]